MSQRPKIIHTLALDQIYKYEVGGSVVVPVACFRCQDFGDISSYVCLCCF